MHTAGGDYKGAFAPEEPFIVPRTIGSSSHFMACSHCITNSVLGTPFEGTKLEL